MRGSMELLCFAVTILVLYHPGLAALFKNSGTSNNHEKTSITNLAQPKIVTTGDKRAAAASKGTIGQPTHFQMDDSSPGIEVQTSAAGINVKARPASLQVMSRPEEIIQHHIEPEHIEYEHEEHVIHEMPHIFHSTPIVEHPISPIYYEGGPRHYHHHHHHHMPGPNVFYPYGGHRLFGHHHHHDHYYDDDDGYDDYDGYEDDDFEDGYKKGDIPAATKKSKESVKKKRRPFRKSSSKKRIHETGRKKN
eukprot:Seg836.10 transcript_id=Seg836.10/GoldUCD/mRNA.D3Y31 product="hypothetical protein" protein_id=Seg836.10/GoldUCD/D3Y31